MTEDPEQVLPEQRVGSRLDAEERRIETALEHQHEQCDSDHWDCEKQQELHNQHHPGEDRKLHEAHARCPHVDDGDDEVDRTS